jgi:hypothetical protein
MLTGENAEGAETFGALFVRAPFSLCSLLNTTFIVHLHGIAFFS